MGCHGLLPHLTSRHRASVEVERLVNRIVPDGPSPPIALVGTTASGKSALAMELARRRGDIEIVSVDSMQVYRGMDIGTAKPSTAEQAEVRHHVIDLVDPWDEFDVRSFQRAVAAALSGIAERGRRAVLVGGTGLYLQAVVDGFEIPGRYPTVAADLETEPDTAALHLRLADLDPVAAGRMEPSNRRRVVRALEVSLGSGRPFSSFGPGTDAYPATPVRLLGVGLPSAVVADRIAARYGRQMADGFLDEVHRLAGGPALSRSAGQALGYRELLAHLRAIEAGPVAAEELPAWAQSLDAALAEAVRRTRQFARRQRAWFRRDPRIEWLDAGTDPSEVMEGLVALAGRHWR